MLLLLPFFLGKFALAEAESNKRIPDIPFQVYQEYLFNKIKSTRIRI